MKWCDSYKENQILITYDTMWETTKKMAESIADGIRNISPSTNILLINSAKHSESEILTEIFKSKGVLFGSPTINNRILPSMAALLEGVKGLNFKDKKVAAFGSYGWNAKNLDIINENLNFTSLKLVNEGIKVNWNLNTESRDLCYKFGQKFASSLTD